MKNFTGIIAGIFVLGIALGSIVTYFYVDVNYKNYVELHVTKSGTFYFQKNQIFSASELRTEEQKIGVMR